MRTSFAHTDPEEGDGRGPLPARQRAPLRQRHGDQEHLVHVQHRIRRRHQQGRRARRGGAVRAARRSSTSGSAASCRRAIARISTARTTRTTGRVYTDGVQDGYPFVFQGRDNGVDVLGPVRQGEGVGRRVRRRVGDRRRHAASRAGRVQVDFWDPEDGYYLNGTYYGDKNLLAIGGAGQVQGERQARPTTSTSCSRRSSPDGGAFTIEAE